MGLVSLLSSNVTSGLINGLVPALFRPMRSIGPFVAQVTIEEIAHDELQITDHPVEIGAMITDHAFKRPAEVIIRCGFSNSSLASLTTQIASVLNVLVTGKVGPLNYSRHVYAQLLQLQKSRILFTVTTGKRTYQNMLLKNIVQPTDERTENVLMLTLHCKEVILVGTRFSFNMNSNGVTPTPVDPVVTNPVINNGTKSAIPASPSPGGASPSEDW